MTKEEKVNKVLDLFHHTPNGIIDDSDTILKEIMDESSFEEIGLSEEMLDIWKNSSDRESVEALFYSFTNVPFDEYLKRCIRETTRNADEVTAMEKLYPIMSEDEKIVKYSVTGDYFERYCIVPDYEIFSLDLCLEETLHRLIENKMTDDIFEILGAKIPTDEELDEFRETEECTYIDLGYYIPGNIYCMDFVDA